MQAFTDLRFALRQFQKSPGFFLTSILVLALGIGASVTVFAFVNAALLKPLPYQNPGRLLAVYGSTQTCPDCGLSYLDYQDWIRANSVFRSLEIWAPTSLLWRHSGDVEALRAGRVSSGFFTTLGVKPALGRLFDSDVDGPSAPRTVVLSYSTWQRKFGGRKHIVGQSVTLDEQSYSVIGVLPREFQFAPRSAQLWVSLDGQDPCNQDRSCRTFYSFARLKDGVSIASARDNMTAVGTQLQAQYPQSNEGQAIAVKPLIAAITGEVQPILLILMTGATLLLLTASVNLAGLLLVRAENRRREMAVRIALGGTVMRLMRQFATEAALLVTISTSFALAASWAVVRILAALIPERVLRGMPYFESIEFDYRILLFVVLAALFAWLICITAPLSRLFGSGLRARLADGARSSSLSLRRFGSNLLVIEMALAMVLLLASGVLGKSFHHILEVPLNFNPGQLATMEIDANTGYDTEPQQLSLGRHLVDALGAYPGVRSVGIVRGQLPVSCNCDIHAYRVKGRPSGSEQLALMRIVTPGYFATLQARLLSGRYFVETDDKSHASVVLINRKMAQQLFPGENPVGQTIGDESLSPLSLHQVIGVVDDIREGQLDASISPAAYFPFNRDPGNYFFVVIRTAQDPMSVIPGLAATIEGLHLGIGIRNEFAMDEHMRHGAAYYLHSSAAWLAGSFAGCALMLSLIGLYGVISYSVSQRTREIGIRMALGAHRSSISELILREAAALVLLGLLSGIVVSFLTRRLLSSLLFEVHSFDFSILALASMVFAATALVAAWIPAHRAAATNPVHALRSE